jgi:hypothetical protein
MFKFKRHAKIQRTLRKIKHGLNSDAPMVIVYQMGKVASSSIYDALKNRSDCCAFHTHTLSRTNIDARKQRTGDSFFAPDKRYRVSDALSKQVIQSRYPTKIITLIRDPFERNISAFFENSKSVQQAKQADEPFIDELIQEYLGSTNHLLPEKWYQNEFFNALDINIFEHSFDPVSGWATIQQGPYDVLILRTTLSDEEKSKRIEDFLNIEDFTMPRSNQTGDKALKHTYQRFKSSIVFPDSIGHSILQSRFTQHFFTPTEIDTMQQRWLKSDTKNAPNSSKNYL